MVQNMKITWRLLFEILWVVLLPYLLIRLILLVMLANTQYQRMTEMQVAHL